MKKYYILIGAALICILAGLLLRIEVNRSKNIGIELPKVNGGSYSCQFLLEDNSILCRNFEETGAVYYRYYPNEKSKIKIGTIENYFLGNDEIAKIDNKIYFYVYVLKDANEGTNQLFEINLEGNILSEEYGMIDASLAGLSTYKFDRKVATLKNIVNPDSSITTFLDVYDPKTKTSSKENEQKWTSYNAAGAAMVAFYSDAKYMYVLQDVYYGGNGKAPSESFLIQYDINMNIVKKYSLNGDALAFIKSWRIKKLSIDNDIIYMQNISSYGYLGKLKSAGIETLLNNVPDLSKATVCSDSEANLNMYFIRRLNICYVYDKESSQLIEKKLRLPDYSAIQSILINGDNLLLSCYVEDEKENIYPTQIFFLKSQNMFVDKLQLYDSTE